MDSTERKTNLTRNLDSVGKDNKTRYDAIAKQILGDKEILARIVNYPPPKGSGLVTTR